MRFTVFFISLLAAIIGNAQKEPPLTDNVFRKNIQSVQLYRDSAQLSYPIIELSGDAPLSLHFDDFDGGGKTYSYSFIQCNSDWTPSGQPVNWYTKGFLQRDITTMTFSFGTAQNYTHYTVKFPSEEMQITQSGNYIIKVFENYDPENVVLMRRFMVVENLLPISGRIRDGVGGETRAQNHDLLFTINIQKIPGLLPQRDLNVTILQNMRYDNMKSNVKPAFQNSNSLDFSLIDGSNSFEAGNEYRYFDMRTIRIRPDKVTNSIMIDDTLHLFVKPELSRKGTTYTGYADLNGNYFISTMDGNDPNTEGNYAYVHFALSSEFGPSVVGNVYMVGAMSGNTLNRDWKMDYNYEKKQYYLTKLLKQGYYNYLFVRQEPTTKQSETGFFENSFNRAENNYIILVYYRDLMQRNDRIVGFEILNSFRNR
jgi:hypothetical protein